MKIFIIGTFILLASCASKPKYPDDIDWDYVFPSDPYMEDCGEIIENDCYYYPPYYYD